MAATAQQQTTLELIKPYQHHAKDVGSSEVQVAMLTARINELTEHMKSNPKDFSTRRGLMKMVGQRRRHQNYLKQKLSQEQYKALLAGLNLRK